MIDVSNPMPADRSSDIGQTVASATRNIMGACAAQEIQRLVVLTIAAIEDPLFDGFPCCEAKRLAKEMLPDGAVPATIVKSTQWYEFATNPAAVTCNDDEVTGQDWLIQPVAADSVADVLVEAALVQTHMPRTVAGPQAVRLPDLTSKLLARQGDSRRIRAAQPELASDGATVIGPDVDTWLHTLAPAGTDGSPAQDGSDKARRD